MFKKKKDAGAEGPISVLEEVGSKARVWRVERGSMEPGLTLFRKQVREDWSEKHRNVAGKIFLEGGWTQKGLFDVGLSDVSQCQACQIEEST